jgi:hypothetical protein
MWVCCIAKVESHTTSSTFLMPWCASCRKHDPQGAKRDYDNRFHHTLWQHASEDVKQRKLAYNRTRRNIAKQRRQPPTTEKHLPKEEPPADAS